MAPATAQVPCVGDLDGDGVVGPDDENVLVSALFADLRAQALAPFDLNRDDKASAADLSVLAGIEGLVCPTATPIGGSTATRTATPTARSSFAATATPTPSSTAARATPSATPTRTPTPKATPTTTPKRTPTATPTEACTETTVGLGATDAEIAAGDCRRETGYGGAAAVRLTDAYVFTASVGTAVTIDVVPRETPPALKPVLRIVDPDGQFVSVATAPPIELTITSALPYRFFVAAGPDSPTETGRYRLTLSSRACPTPEVLPVPSTRSRALDGTECPDPASPSTSSTTEPVDQYLFTVSEVPATLEILMRAAGSTSEVNPAFSVIGPDGYELFDPELTEDAYGLDENGVDAIARFLALQTGQYRIIARSAGEFGAYSLTVNVPTGCAPTALDTFPTTVAGKLYGNRRTTPCAAPLGMPLISDEAPEPNSPAALYTFTAALGEVVGIAMDSDHDSHVFLLGPESAGYPLVARNDDAGGVFGAGSQLATTVPQTGKYMIVAALNDPLDPPDPEDPEDTQGEEASYSLSVRRCPSAGSVSLNPKQVLSSRFNAFDCVGFGGLPVRSYSLQGTAGKFLSIGMDAPGLDSQLRLIGPDGSVVESSADPLAPTSRGARINRILTATGVYYVEASASNDGAAPDLPAQPPFTVEATSCTPGSAQPGALSGSLATSTCEIAAGRPVAVYAITGAADTVRAATAQGSGTLCVLGLTADGEQIPSNACNAEMATVPVTAGALQGVVIAAAGGPAGTYNVPFAVCPAVQVGFAESRQTSLRAEACRDAAGAPADWYLLRAPAALVRNNDGFNGALQTDFPAAARLTDRDGTTTIGGEFSREGSGMIPIGTDLGAIVEVSGATAGDRGAYTLVIDPAVRRQ